jgi:hypothetical protein
MPAACHGRLRPSFGVLSEGHIDTSNVYGLQEVEIRWIVAFKIQLRVVLHQHNSRGTRAPASGKVDPEIVVLEPDGKR